MTYWICYHNAEKHGRLPGDSARGIDLTRFSATGDSSGARHCGIITGKGSVYDSAGDIVFVITGVGRSPKKYFLWSWFIVDRIRDRRDEFIEAYGTTGIVLNPAPQLLGDDFDEFRRANGNFGLGFQNITKQPYLSRLIDLVASQDLRIVDVDTQERLWP